MKAAKFEIEKFKLRDGSIERRALSNKAIDAGENIAKIGYEVDFLLHKLELRDAPPSKLVSYISKSDKANCEYFRDANTCWYLRATKNIKENRVLSVSNPQWWS